MIFPHSLFRYNVYVQELTKILQNAEAGYELIAAKLSQVKGKQGRSEEEGFYQRLSRKASDFLENLTLVLMEAEEVLVILRGIEGGHSDARQNAGEKRKSAKNKQKAKKRKIASEKKKVALEKENSGQKENVNSQTEEEDNKKKEEDCGTNEKKFTPKEEDNGSGEEDSESEEEDSASGEEESEPIEKPKQLFHMEL